MSKKPRIILAINPGSKYIGTAVLQGESLRDWRIKVVNGKWSKEKYAKAGAIITKLIDYHQPDAVALKQLHPSRSSLHLCYLVEQIKDIAQEREIPVYRYSIQEIKNFFAPGERINKKGLAGIVAARLPDLFHDFKKAERSKNLYLTRMFEAVALGIICFNKIDNH